LPAGERAVLARASVVGKQFGAGEVAYLSDGDGPISVRAPLMAMVRRNLLRPAPDAILPMGIEDEAFQFRHHLIRDGAYAGMSKAERARLHERYASWLEELPAERLSQLDEIVGYHLEQAHLLWAPLGGEPGTTDAGPRAAAHLSSAGLRAQERSDPAGAANLLTRAAHLLPYADPQRVRFMPRLGEVLFALGRYDEGQAASSEVFDATTDGSDPAARVTALLVSASIAGAKGATVAERMPDMKQALAIAEATGDLALIGTVHQNLGWLATQVGRLGEARREFEFVVEAGRRSNDLLLEGAGRAALMMATWYATPTASDIQRALAENLSFARKLSRRGPEAHTLRTQAVEAARQGRFLDARRLVAECLEILEDAGLAVLKAAASWELGYVESLAGDPVAREAVLRDGYEQLDAMGERGLLSTIAADLADALLDLGRIDEAAAECAIAEEAGAEDDVLTQVRVRLVRGRLAAARGDTDEALGSVASALALADEGEYYDLRTTSRLVFAQLLVDVGRIEEARARAQEVIDLARHRGDIVFEGRARDILESSASIPTQS
jgi:tetratricopeptide (TPR) repeat protein